MLRIFRQYYPIRNIFFVIGESLVIYISVLAANWILSGGEPIHFDHWLCLKILLMALVCQSSLYYNNLYDLNVTDRFRELGIRLLQSLGASAIFLAGIYLLFPGSVIRHGIFAVSVSFIIIFIISWRFCYTIILNRGMFNQNILLLGSGRLAQSIAVEIIQRKDCGCTVAGIGQEGREDDDLKIKKLFTDINPLIICKEDYSNLPETAKRLKIRKIVVAFTERRRIFPTEALLRCRVENGIEILEGNTFYEMLTGKLLVEYINPSWFIFSDGFQKSLVRRFIKRITDIILSSVILIIFLPVIILFIILIRIDSKGSPFYSQERVGMRKKIYNIYKLRSMFTSEEELPKEAQTGSMDSRITRVGKIIRIWHIDEIPQIWNVLKGEMSIVGPRPEQKKFADEFEHEIQYYRERFTVKPGITGWAQINYGYGAGAEGAEEKLKYDLFYIKNVSFFMDLMIIVRTGKKVIAGEGSTPE